MHRFIRAALSLENLIGVDRSVAAVVGAFALPFLDKFVSSTSGRLYLLLLAVVVADWIPGIIAAKKDDTYSSEYGTAGVFRTLLILWLPLVGFLLDSISHKVPIDTHGSVYYAITSGLIYHSWHSMTANAYRAGWGRWIPRFALKIVSSEIKAKEKRAAEKKKLG